jgi:hypothetical protein
MSLLQLLCLILTISAIAIINAADGTSKSKVLRAQRQSVKFGNSFDVTTANGAVVSTPKRVRGSKRTRLSPVLRPIATARSFARAVKDEAVDIFDALVFAETQEERIENALEILDRHKLIIAGGAAAWVIKTRVLSKSAQSVGQEMINELRKKEIEKWGIRGAI